MEFVLPVFPLGHVRLIEGSLQKAGKIDDALRKDLDEKVQAESPEGGGKEK